MPAILRNDDAESLILDIRAGRNAADQGVGDRTGGFLIFPTSVVIAGRGSARLVYPLSVDLEPGTLVTGGGEVQVSARVSGVTVTGAFSWASGAVAAPEARYRFSQRGREIPEPSWASQLPASRTLALQASTSLLRQQIRLLRRGRDSEHCLLALTEQVMRRFCGGPVHRAIRCRPVVDVDDLVQRGLQTAARLLPLYASKDRPPCSWLGMLRLDGRRDVHREVSRLDWLPGDAVVALALAEAGGVTRGADPVATLSALVAAAERLGRPTPRIAPTRLDVALRAPAIVVHEMTAAAADSGHEFLDDGGGAVATTVARLVTDDAGLIALVASGDPRALNRVGDQVVRRLSENRESAQQARRRCWEQFQRSGQLFASAAGLERFATVADPICLAAIDESLRRSAGIRVSPGGG